MTDTHEPSSIMDLEAAAARFDQSARSSPALLVGTGEALAEAISALNEMGWLGRHVGWLEKMLGGYESGQPEPPDMIHLDQGQGCGIVVYGSRTDDSSPLVRGGVMAVWFINETAWQRGRSLEQTNNGALLITSSDRGILSFVATRR